LTGSPASEEHLAFVNHSNRLEKIGLEGLLIRKQLLK
jgi:hypothetical protein